MRRSGHLTEPVPRDSLAPRAPTPVNRMHTHTSSPEDGRIAGQVDRVHWQVSTHGQGSFPSRSAAAARIMMEEASLGVAQAQGARKMVTHTCILRTPSTYS